MLLEEVEQVLHDFLFVVSGLLALRLHLLGVGNVGGVVRHRLERLDQLVDLLDFAGSLCRLQQSLPLQLKWINFRAYILKVLLLFFWFLALVRGTGR